MVFVLNLFFLLLGFSFLVYFGDKLVDNAVAIAQKWNISSSVIAVTLLAAGTSAPELVTSFIAAFQKSADISVGNVVGSNIFNLLAVGGASIFLAPAGKHNTAFFSWPFLIFGSGLFTLILSDYTVSQNEGFVMLGGVTAFIIYSLTTQNSDASPGEPSESSAGILKLILWTAISFAGLIGGANLALKGGVALGQMAGLSERIIGITIISVGTGLPELSTSIAAVIKGRSDMAIANVLGSNIYNTLGIPGVTASVFPLAAHKSLWVPDTMVMVAATLAVGLIFLFRSPGLNRALGLSFIGSYIGYVLYLIF